MKVFLSPMKMFDFLYNEREKNFQLNTKTLITLRN